METTQTTDKFKPVAYWLPLHTFYSDKSTLVVTLADSEGNVQVKITPCLPGMEGSKAQAGQQKYDYNNSVAITLNLNEITALVSAYETGLLNQVQIASFYHKSQNGAAITGGLAVYQNRILFTINDQARQSKQSYFFGVTKVGQQGQEAFIPSEINLFISVLKSVLNSLPFIKAKNIFPIYVPKNPKSQQPQQTQGYQQYSQPNNNYQQAHTQQNYVNNAPSSGLPTSSNTPNPSNMPTNESFDF